MKSAEQIHASALRLLARRNHSSGELRAKLKLRGFAEQDITEEITRLQEVDLLDDVVFCQEYIRMRANKGFGPARIVVELRNKHLDLCIIDDSLEHCSIDWQEIRSQVLAKKSHNLLLSSDRQERMKQLAKLARFLEQRGFSSHNLQLDFET